MSKLVIRSDEEAFAWLERYMEGNVDVDGIELEGWPVLTVRLTGNRFDQSLTPTVMKGIIDLQKGINRAYAQSKYGEPSTVKLSQEERNDLEIRVKVDKGSTLLEINFQDFLTNVATKAVTNMDPTTIAVTVISLGVIWGAKASYSKYLEDRRDARIQEAKTEEEKAHLETKRMEMFAKVVKSAPGLDDEVRYADDARGSLLKGFSGADRTDIAGAELDKETTEDLMTNARRKADEVRLDGNYRILRNDTTNPIAFKVKVRNPKTGQEFEALVQNESLNQDYKEMLRVAEWDRELVYLSINAKSLDGEVRNAVVIGVRPPKQEK